MVLVVRRLLAICSACGLTAGLLIYVRSFLGTTMDGIMGWAIFLHVGVFLLLVPMYALEYSAIRGGTFFWKAFPKQAARAIQVLGLFCIFHFLFFLVQSHASSPKIENGDYVLDDHGRTVRVISQSEYLSLKGSELRLFATGWMF